MNYVAKSVVPGENFAVFSQGLNISLQDLKVIMGWGVMKMLFMIVS